VVTFLFTDIEGSPRRWEADADAMRSALLAHDDVQLLAALTTLHDEGRKAPPRMISLGAVRQWAEPL
jgi:class 3 adenylate cyclase